MRSSNIKDQRNPVVEIFTNCNGEISFSLTPETTEPKKKRSRYVQRPKAVIAQWKLTW